MTKTPDDSGPKSGFNRRDFLVGSGAAAAVSAVATREALAADKSGPAVVRGKTTVELNVNGQTHRVSVEPRTTLLEALRYQLDLTGAKPVSGDGSSGASTVIVDGRLAMASTMLAISVRGKKIQTVESLAESSIPAAFVKHDAQQCGFCTPGFVVAVRSFLDKYPNATEDQIRAGLNHNICRCGTYANIIQAVIDVVKGGGNG